MNWGSEAPPGNACLDNDEQRSSQSFTGTQASRHRTRDSVAPVSALAWLRKILVVMGRHARAIPTGHGGGAAAGDVGRAAGDGRAEYPKNEELKGVGTRQDPAPPPPPGTQPPAPSLPIDRGRGEGDVDFLVSSIEADREWAEWIAWQLEERDEYRCSVQVWDLQPIPNFVLQDG